MSVSPSARKYSFESLETSSINSSFAHSSSTTSSACDEVDHKRLKRLQENQAAIQSLQQIINRSIATSCLFTAGRQEEDHYRELFLEFFQMIRGGSAVVKDSAQYLVNRFKMRSDMTYSFRSGEEYDSHTYYCPTRQLADGLESCLEETNGLQQPFLNALSKNYRKFSDVGLEERDTSLRNYYVLCRVFPRCTQTLKSIFERLLAIQWLEEDSNSCKLYLQDRDAVDRPMTLTKDEFLWALAKLAAEKQREHDAKLSEKHWNQFKDDVCHTMVSGALSLLTRSPSFVVGQSARTAMNVAGNQIDPEGTSKSLKALKLVGTATLGHGLGGNAWDLGSALGVDLLDLAGHSQQSSEEKILLRGYANALIKGALTADRRKLTQHLLGFLVTEITNQLPETTAETQLGDRLTLAALTNPDVQGHFIDKCVQKAFELVAAPVEENKHKQEAAETSGEKLSDKDLEEILQNELQSAKSDIEFEPMTIQFESPEPSHIIRQRIEEISKEIDQTTQELTKTDEVIRIGTELLANLPASGEVVDNAHYEVIKKNGDWRVYRDGVELYAEGVNKSNSKAKKNCHKMIPSLKEKYGTPIPSQASDQAKKALNIANDQKVALLQKLLNLQQQLSQKQCGSPTQEEIKVQNAEFEKRMQEELVRTRVITQSREEALKKQTGVDSAWCYLDDKMDDYSRHYKEDAYYSKLVKAIKNYNQAIGERDASVNHYNALLGIPDRIETPKVEIPKKASNWEKTKLWIDRNVEISINFSKSIPLYPTTPPSLTDRDVPPETPKESSYEAPIDQPKSSPYGLNFKIPQEPASFDPNIPIAIPNPFCPGLAKEITPSASTPKEPAQTYNWLEIQQYQQQRMFDTNMSFKSPPQPSRIDYGDLRDLGMPLPSTTMAQAIQSGTRDPEHKPSNLPLQMAGILPFAISKAVPEQTQRKVTTWIKNYIQEWKDDPIKAKKDLDLCVILGAKKAVVIAIQAFEQPSLKKRRNAIGLMELSDRCDCWVAQKFNIDLNSPNAQMGMFIGEFSIPLPLVAQTKPVIKLGQEALILFRQSSRFLKPLSMRSAVVAPRMTMTRNLLIEEASVKHAKVIQAARGINRSNNHQFVTWVENSQTRTASIGEMSHAGTFHDRGGRSYAGRALEKKGGRVGSVFPKATGNIHEINMQGQRILDEILNHPDKVIIRDIGKNRYGDVFDIKIGSEKGMGVRFKTNGEFVGFLEPTK